MSMEVPKSVEVNSENPIKGLNSEKLAEEARGLLSSIKSYEGELITDRENYIRLETAAEKLTSILSSLTPEECAANGLPVIHPYRFTEQFHSQSN